MDRIVTEGEELGIHWYMCTGGEPTCRKEDLFKLAAKHQNSVFHLFTNGTLIDQAFCDRVKEVGNMAFFISIEASAMPPMTAAARASMTASCTPWI